MIPKRERATTLLARMEQLQEMAREDGFLSGVIVKVYGRGAWCWDEAWSLTDGRPWSDETEQGKREDLSE